MKKLRNRLFIAWQALTWTDVLCLAFKRGRDGYMGACSTVTTEVESLNGMADGIARQFQVLEVDTTHRNHVNDTDNNITK